MVITIDGPAGVGKSSVASQLARDLKFLLLKSGSFYRALSLRFWQLGLADFAAVRAGISELWPLIAKTRIAQQGEHILLEGCDVSDQLQTPELDRFTALMSQLPPLRHFINELLRQQAANHNLLAEGRDMGTVVFADAEHKFFLDASLNVRARRRWGQFNAEEQAQISLEELEEQIKYRDEIDRNKDEGVLRAAENSRIIDTSNLTFNEVCLIITQSLSDNHLNLPLIPNL